MKLTRPAFPPTPKELDAFASTIERLFTEIIAVLNGRVSLGDLTIGSANIEGTPVKVADTGTADVEFTINHDLGRVPILYLYNISKTGYVYDSQRNLWTTSTLRLKCSAANAVLTLFVFG